MFHNKRLNNKINSIHERALTITYHSVSMHNRNLQILAMEMFRNLRSLSLKTLREKFVSKTSSYNLRRNDSFERSQVHFVYHSTESLLFLGPKTCHLITIKLKWSENLHYFIIKIKNVIASACPFTLCKTYIQQVGLLYSCVITCCLSFLSLMLLLL